MSKNKVNLVAIIVKYDTLLRRYAHFMVKDPAVAAHLVKKTFEKVYAKNGFVVKEDQLRKQFKEHTLGACRLWLAVKGLYNHS